MAKQLPFLGISGKIGNLVFYRMNGKNYVRSTPKIRKTSDVRRARGFQFALASGMTKTIRHQLLPIIPYPSDLSMQNRLMAVVMAFVKESSGSPDLLPECLLRINKFNFTERGFDENETWVSVLKIVQESSKRLSIRVPAFVPTEVISAPLNTDSVLCKIVLSVLNPQSGKSIGNALTTIDFPFNKSKVKSKTIQVKLPCPKKSLLITGLSLNFKATNKYALNREEESKYFQSAIIGAMAM